MFISVQSSTVSTPKPDIIVVTEVFPKHRIDNIVPVELSIDGYDLFFIDFSSERDVCLLCKTVYQAACY